jgi:hypothetical protein
MREALQRLDEMQQKAGKAAADNPALQQVEQQYNQTEVKNSSTAKKEK